MSTQRPYQGYPYVNPVVIDVPSLDAASAAKYTNLPRRQIQVTPTRTAESNSNKRLDVEDRDEAKEAESSQETESSKAQWETIDRIGTESSSEREADECSPVVYIDIPDNNASSVVESPRTENAGERLEAGLQETTRYDPLRSRTVEVQASIEDSDDEDDSRPPPRDRYFPPRPPPPSTLQAPSQGNSSGMTPPSHTLPPFMSKEASCYGRLPSQDDGFLLAPIPVTDFPEPPPAYTEIDRVNQPSVETSPPPRTEVVTTVTDPTNTIRPGSDRKLLQCQHCGQRVHSLVVRESGAFTHILALIVAFLCLIPIVIIIYCTDGCKYKNHYCPNCNQLIGYEIPILCQQMAFV